MNSLDSLVSGVRQSADRSPDRSSAEHLSLSVLNDWQKLRNIATEHPLLTVLGGIAVGTTVLALTRGRAGSMLAAESVSNSLAAATKVETLAARGAATVRTTEAIAVQSLRLGNAARPISALGMRSGTIAEELTGVGMTETRLAAPFTAAGRIGSRSLDGIPVALEGGQNGRFRLTMVSPAEALGSAVDLHPQIPKMVISDPILRMGGLVTDFTGDMPRLYGLLGRNSLRIEAYKTIDGLRRVNVGSGFLMKGELFTANHVVRGADEIRVFANMNSRRGLLCALEYSDPNRDLAILKLTQPGGRLISRVRELGVRPATEALRESEQVIGFGYPNGVGRMHALPGNFRDFKVVQLGETAELRGNALRSFMIAEPGSSGSAVLDGQGRVLGMIVQSNAVENTSLSLPAAQLFAGL